jgi:LPS-assembly protein
MSSGRRSRIASARRGLLAGAAVAALWAGCAWAQAPAVGAPAVKAPAAEPPVATAPGPDGLTKDEMYLEGDEVVYDDKAKVVTAKGSVEMRTDQRTLRADQLTYDETRGVIHAEGGIQIINPDGTVETAHEVMIDEKTKAGAATGFTARLQQNIKLAGASLVRRDDTIQQLNQAIYTPCPICADGKSKTPTWSIQAERVVQDKKKQVIYYRNATMRLFGVPVAYLPVFWHADPKAERKSGLLQPKASISDRRGFSYEQPYLQVISPYSDLVISPQFNSEVNPFLNLRARKRFYSGMVDARFGYTYDRDFDGSGDKFGDRTSRSYILAGGAFQLDEKWRWGFTAERTSDRLLFDKYEIGRVYEARGPYVADDRRLISQIYTTRQDQRSYVSLAGMAVQGLRPGDNDRAFPLIGPLLDARWEPQSGVAGGRLRARASAVALSREQSPLDVTGERTPGLDSRRATAELDWRAAWTRAMGLRIAPYLNVRGDAYNLSDLPTGATRSKNVARGLATGGADISMPFVRRWKDATVVLEPLAQVAISPDAQPILISRDAAGEPIYLNEDSLAFEFDESNLFRVNKFPGYDIYETGLRLNVAGRASVLWDDGRRASLLVGRSFRDQRDDVFAASSGLRSRGSDWVVAADAQPIQGLSLFTRARLDAKTLAVHRAETGANLASKWGSGYVRYLRDERDINGNKTENLDVGAEVFLTKHWGISAYGNRDLVQQAWVIRDIGVVYRDECTRIDVVYRHEDAVIGRLGPSDSIAIRLTLATLGEPLYTR